MARAPKDQIPDITIGRFPKYLAVARALAEQDWDYITSSDMARACDMHEVLVRKELARTGVVGRKHRGFRIHDLIKAIERIIAWTTPRDAVVVGTGPTASLLIHSPRITNQGLRFVYAVSPFQNEAGGGLGDLEVVSFETFAARQAAAEKPVRLAALASRFSTAQHDTDMLVASGVKAIWNFTAATLAVPPDVKVVDSDLNPGLAVLCNSLRLAGV